MALVVIGLSSCASLRHEEKIESVESSEPWPAEASALHYLRFVQENSGRFVSYAAPPKWMPPLGPEPRLFVSGQFEPMSLEIALGILELNGYTLVPITLRDGTEVYTVIRTLPRALHELAALPGATHPVTHVFPSSADRCATLSRIVRSLERREARGLRVLVRGDTVLCYGATPVIERIQKALESPRDQ